MWSGGIGGFSSPLPIFMVHSPSTQFATCTLYSNTSMFQYVPRYARIHCCIEHFNHIFFCRRKANIPRSEWMNEIYEFRPKICVQCKHANGVLYQIHICYTTSNAKIVAHKFWWKYFRWFHFQVSTWGLRTEGPADCIQPFHPNERRMLS